MMMKKNENIQNHQDGSNELSEWVEKRLKIQDDILEELTKEIDGIRDEIDKKSPNHNNGDDDLYYNLKNDILKIQKQVATLNKMKGITLNGDKELNDKERVQKWLKDKVKLPQYYELFIHQGFDDLESIADVTKDDLSQMGIDKVGHQRKILKNAEQI